MPAYAIADIEVTDEEAFKRYGARVPATIEKHGGKYLVRGGETELLEGDRNPKRVVVIEFPNMKTLKKWYNSEEYQELLALRLSASSGNFFIVEGY